jgi:glycine/D-amino acid oxidase-like deaminating enzyme
VDRAGVDRIQHRTNVEACDLIVVGAGGSGMIAAAEAARQGLKVIVFEKTPQVGGTTGLSVGTIMAARSRLPRGYRILLLFMPATSRQSVCLWASKMTPR